MLSGKWFPQKFRALTIVVYGLLITTQSVINHMSSNQNLAGKKKKLITKILL